MSDDIQHHISVYKKVFVALLILTVLTVLASYVEFGGIVWLAVGVGLAVGIAVAVAITIAVSVSLEVAVESQFHDLHHASLGPQTSYGSESEWHLQD